MPKLMEDSVTAASASKTSDRSRSKATRDPLIEPPAKFERTLKVPGSKKLVLGEWVEVLPDDEDAATKKQKRK
jgi:hypothetical protein